MQISHFNRIYKSGGLRPLHSSRFKGSLRYILVESLGYNLAQA